MWESMLSITSSLMIKNTGDRVIEVVRMFLDLGLCYLSYLAYDNIGYFENL